MNRALLALCVMLPSMGCSRTDPASSSAQTTLTSAELHSSRISFLERDPHLTRRVESAIAAEPLLSLAAKNVEVTVEHGVATLRGSVQDKEILRELERVVATVPGVDRVQNDVDVNVVRDWDQSESDERIAFALQRSLASTPGVGDDSEQVSIDVVRGQVTLRGATRFASTQARIGQIVERTPGVVAVANELRVH